MPSIRYIPLENNRPSTSRVMSDPAGGVLRFLHGAETAGVFHGRKSSMKLKIFMAAAAVFSGTVTFGVCMALVALTQSPILPFAVGILAMVGASCGAAWWHKLIARSVEIDLEDAYRDRRVHEASAEPRRQAVRYALPADADEVRDRLAAALTIVGEAAQSVLQAAHDAVQIFPDLETKLGDVGQHIESLRAERDDFRKRALLGDAAAAILRGESPPLETVPETDALSPKFRDRFPSMTEPPPQFIPPRHRAGLRTAPAREPDGPNVQDFESEIAALGRRNPGTV